MATPLRCGRCSRVVLLAITLAPSTSAFAATYTVTPFTITIPDAIPAAEKIRGAIAVQRWSPMVTEGKGKSQFDAFIIEQRLATIDAGFQDRNLSREEIDAEVQSLIAAFDTVAVRAARPELRYVGFIYQGCSVHGARSMSEGFGNPYRTIAVISFCGRNYALFDLLPSFSPFMPELSFPHLQVSNGNDLDRVPWNDTTTRQVRREARGLWTSSLHPRLGHCEAAADGIAFELLWLREAIKARIPAVIPDGPYTLAKLSDADGWLGDYVAVLSTDSGSVFGSGYELASARIFAASTVPASEVGEHVWFPTRVAAEEWKHYSDTGTCCLGITEPTSSCGDGTCSAGTEECRTCPLDCGACPAPPGAPTPDTGSTPTTGDTPATGATPATGDGSATSGNSGAVDSSAAGGANDPGRTPPTDTTPAIGTAPATGSAADATGAAPAGLAPATPHGCGASGASLISCLLALGALRRRELRS